MNIDPESEKQKLWEEAREWAVAEILSKYHKELQEAHSKHFRLLIKRAVDLHQQAQTDMPLRESCPECFGYGGFHSDNCSRVTVRR